MSLKNALLSRVRSKLPMIVTDAYQANCYKVLVSCILASVL